MTCTASSAFDKGWSCQQAIDGSLDTNDWATKKEGMGAWINLDFGKYYNVKMISK